MSEKNQMVREFFSRRYLYFLFSGGTSAIAGVLLRIFFSRFMYYAEAVLISYIFSTLVAYFINKILVFKTRASDRRKELMKFFAVNVLGLIQVLVLSEIFSRSLMNIFLVHSALSETLGHAAALSTLAITSFILHRYWTFSERNSAITSKNE